MQPARWRIPRPAWGTFLCLALLFGVLAQAPASAQQPAPADAKELVAVLELEGVGATQGERAAASEELRAQLLHSGRFRVREVPAYSARKIRALRLRHKLSQAVLASVLNTSLSTVRQWEIGAKHPRGPSLKLLHLLDRKGIEALV